MNEAGIKALHEIYCRESNLQLDCTMSRMFTWEAFMLRFNASDLSLVCKNMRRLVKEGRRFKEPSMGFRRLIGDLENFEELLAEFRALQRRPRYAPGKSDVLGATGRPSQPEQPPALSFKDHLKRLEVSDKLRAFRKSL